MNAIMAAKMRRNLEFDTPYTVTNALSKGGAETKLSALVMGLGNMAHKQVLKGLLFLAAEVAYIAFMVTNGVHNLQMLITLGSVERQEVWNEELAGVRVHGGRPVHPAFALWPCDHHFDRCDVLGLARHAQKRLQGRMF